MNASDRYHGYCLQPTLPPVTNTRTGMDRRMKALRRRIRKLKSMLVKVQRQELSLAMALEQEEDKLNEAREIYEALGQAIDARPQTGMHVSPVHGHTRKASEKGSKTSTRKLRQETPQAETARSGGGNTDAGSGVVGVERYAQFRIEKSFIV